MNQGAGDPVIIVGLPDAAVKESRDRVTTAIEIAAIFGRAGPPKVNLALAGIKKVGASVDLPIALGTIADSRVRLSERTSGHAMTIIARSPSP